MLCSKCFWLYYYQCIFPIINQKKNLQRPIIQLFHKIIKKTFENVFITRLCIHYIFNLGSMSMIYLKRYCLKSSWIKYLRKSQVNLAYKFKTCIPPYFAAYFCIIRLAVSSVHSMFTLWPLASWWGSKSPNMYSNVIHAAGRPKMCGLAC